MKHMSQDRISRLNTAANQLRSEGHSVAYSLVFAAETAGLTLMGEGEYDWTWVSSDGECVPSTFE